MAVPFRSILGSPRGSPVGKPENRSVAVRGLPRCHGAAAVRGPTHVICRKRRVDPLAGYFGVDLPSW